MKIFRLFLFLVLLFGSGVAFSMSKSAAFQACRVAQVANAGNRCAAMCDMDWSGTSNVFLFNGSWVDNCYISYWPVDSSASDPSTNYTQNTACDQSATVVDTSVTAVGGSPTATRGGKISGVDLGKVAIGVGVGAASGLRGGLPGAFMGAAFAIASAYAAAAATDPPVINQNCNIVSSITGSSYTSSQIQTALQAATTQQLAVLLSSAPAVDYNCMTGGVKNGTCTIQQYCDSGNTFSGGVCQGSNTSCPNGQTLANGVCTSTTGTGTGTGTTGTGTTGTGTNVVSSPVLICTPPQVKNAAGDACVNPSSSSSSSPLSCTPPQVLNSAGDGCVNNPASDLCSLHPDVLGCLPPGSSSPVDIPTFPVLPTFNSALNERGSMCPAPLPLDTRFYHGSFSLEPVCNWARGVRPLIIAAFSIASLGVLMPALRG